MENLNIVSHYIRIQIPSCLCMAGLGLHIDSLGSLVQMSVALTEMIFKKKCLRIFLVEIVKIFLVVKLLQWKIGQFPQGISAEIFSWKSAWLKPQTFQPGIPKLKEKYVNLLLPCTDSWKSGCACTNCTSAMFKLSIGSVYDNLHISDWHENIVSK